MDFNMWQSEMSKYIFMVWKDSLEVLLTSLLVLKYCSHTVSQRCARQVSAEHHSEEERLILQLSVVSK